MSPHVSFINKSNSSLSNILQCAVSPAVCYFFFLSLVNTSMPVVCWKNPPWCYSLIFLSFSVRGLKLTVRDGKWNCDSSIWDLEVLPQMSTNFYEVFATETETHAAAQLNLNTDLSITLSSDQPYWSINWQDVRLKSSSISPRGPNWSWRSGDVYVPIGLLPLWIQRMW